MTFPLSKSSQCHTSLEVLPSEDSTIAVSTDDNKASKKKSTTTISETFQVPSHLIPLESDTAAEQNRKRRTIKALKRQHKEKVKEVHATSKQQSWQQFSNKVSNKKGTTKTSSIWRTSETRGVGIVSAATADGGVIDESRSSSNKRLKSGTLIYLSGIFGLRQRRIYLVHWRGVGVSSSPRWWLQLRALLYNSLVMWSSLLLYLWCWRQLLVDSQIRLFASSIFLSSPPRSGSAFR